MNLEINQLDQALIIEALVDKREEIKRELKNEQQERGAGANSSYWQGLENQILHISKLIARVDSD
jgi:hypothetical protein